MNLISLRHAVCMAIFIFFTGSLKSQQAPVKDTLRYRVDSLGELLVYKTDSILHADLIKPTKDTARTIIASGSNPVNLDAVDFTKAAADPAAAKKVADVIKNRRAEIMSNFKLTDRGGRNVSVINTSAAPAAAAPAAAAPVAAAPAAPAAPAVATPPTVIEQVIYFLGADDYGITFQLATIANIKVYQGCFETYQHGRCDDYNDIYKRQDILRHLVRSMAGHELSRREQRCTDQSYQSNRRQL